MGAELIVSSEARRGALQLLAATSMPDVVLVDGPAPDVSPADSDGVRLVTDGDRCLVPLAPERTPRPDAIDPWELVRRHLSGVGPVRVIGALEVVGAQGLGERRLVGLRARSASDPKGDIDEDRLIAASSSRVARLLADDAVSVPVVTLSMIVGSRVVITDDPDVALLSAALHKTVHFSGAEHALPLDLASLPATDRRPDGGSALGTFLATAMPSTRQPIDHPTQRAPWDALA